MKVYFLNDLLSYAECLLCAGTLVIVLARRQFRTYLHFALFLAVRLLSDLVMGTMLTRTRHLQPTAVAAMYRAYFYVYWTSYALEAALLLLSVYGIYRLAMAPLDGLQRLGNLVFRWICSISVVISICIALGPRISNHDFIVRAVSQLQQTSSILTLCLLIFVCFAIRPMGLSFRSRIFGVSLGLGLLSTVNLVASAWFAPSRNMYSPLSFIQSIAVCASFTIWSLYLLFPEPPRRMIVLPTTSPFLRWNQISLALGDDPGYVAIAGIPPEMIADAEIEVMTRASRKMMIEFSEEASRHVWQL